MTAIWLAWQKMYEDERVVEYALTQSPEDHDLEHIVFVKDETVDVPRSMATPLILATRAQKGALPLGGLKQS
ncbi:MAG: hypothetical protein L0G99_01045 [Propionibacteriales bacterium]|nr:hypothetical protein [Propionibacteriales bacterium]